LNKVLSIFLLLFSIVSLNSCSEEEVKRNTGLLPGSTGGSLEVMVVMEDSLWKSSIGSVIIEGLASPMPGMPQEERWYKLIHIKPKDFNDLLKRSHLVVYVEIDSVNKASILNDFWAKPQMVLSYKGKTQKELLELIKQRLEQDQKDLRRFENTHILKRLSRQKASPSKLLKNSNLRLTIPANLELDTDENDISIYWSRNMKSDQCLMVYKRPLEDELSLLGGDILTVRDSVCKRFIPGQFEGSYMTTEYRMAPMINPHEIDGRFALESRGLWRVEGDFMGGPFLNYTVFDEENQQIITMEGFVFAPELDKRGLLFELESVMNSLRFPK
jgi:hypothetical protein